jgi:AP-4 complex subunit epsilon-1
MSSGGHLSKEFFELVKSIGESRSKQEEDQIIQREVQTLKKAMAEKQVTNKQMKEYIIRMLYVEMLGHDASFGHIHAVKMVSTKDLMMKRVGYLGCSLTLHQDHQFMLLLVNTLQTDLKSDNYLETCMALMVIAKLVNAELIPVLLPLVVKTLEHAQAHVRKKAIVVLHRFYQIDQTCITPLMDKVRKILCDKDPSVMGASLWLFIDVCAAKPSGLKDIV